MAEQDYKKALQSARQELEKLLTERTERESRIASLKQTVDALAVLCNEPTDYFDGITPATSITSLIPGVTLPGVTDAIRSILYHSKTKMSVPEVRDALSQKLDTSTWVNAMAVIHNTLRRLERQAEASVTDKRWQLTLKGRAVFARSLTA